MKALMVLPTLLLQKTSFTSKSKGNVETLKRRLNQWKDGQIEKLLVKGKISKKDYLKTAQRIKVQIGKQLYLLGLWKTEK